MHYTIGISSRRFQLGSLEGKNEFRVGKPHKLVFDQTFEIINELNYSPFLHFFKSI